MNEKQRRVLVIGGGASGMAAAYFAAKGGASVTLFEKNEKLGKKLYITGKGRCNVTNAADADGFLSQVVSNARFLYSAVHAFDSRSVMQWFEDLGCPLKTERGSRVFPVSDHASDIIRVLERALRNAGVTIRLHTPVVGLLFKEGKTAGVQLADGSDVSGDAVILAAGGLSYPLTGSTGDGYRFAETAGHTIRPVRPALVPLILEEAYPAEMEGLSLRNIRLTIPYGRKKTFSEFGELLFTKDGISGPLALRASSVIGAALEEGSLQGAIDLKPALSAEQLDGRIRNLFAESPNRSFKNTIRPLFPASLCPVIVRLSSVPEDKPVHDVTKAERQRFLGFIKAFPLTVIGTHPFQEAVITQGGVYVKEVFPATMESRLCPGLYLTGEVLDLDAFTGGFNLQIAWSTGYCAGTAAAAEP